MFNIYPGVDKFFNFPPEVREAFAQSMELAAKLDPVVSDILSRTPTVQAAVDAAVDPALSEAIDQRNLVEGSVESTGEDVGSSIYAGGFLGEDGRPTDLTFGPDGRVPDPILEGWAARMGTGTVFVEGTGSQEASGGFVGENGRETELVFDDEGAVTASVMELWSERMGPLIGDHIPGLNSVLNDPPRGLASRNLIVKDAFGNFRRQHSRTDLFAAWGDSLTDGWPKPPFLADQSDSWPGRLAVLLGKTVYNGGKSGQSADEIALRQGGLVVFVSPVGGSIPATGGVEVTTDQKIGWRFDRGWSCVGTLAGIDGTLSRNGTTQPLTFTRTSDGTAVVISKPQPFISTQGETHEEATSIFMLGRNDIGYTTTVEGDRAARIVAANVAAVESLSPINKRFLILGTINASGENKGNNNYNQVLDSNNALQALYPDNFLDIRSYIVKQSIYDQGITPTADDLSRMNGDSPPMSIMTDSVHYSPGTAATVAQQIYNWLVQKGWN